MAHHMHRGIESNCPNSESVFLYSMLKITAAKMILTVRTKIKSCPVFFVNWRNMIQFEWYYIIIGNGGTIDIYIYIYILGLHSKKNKNLRIVRRRHHNWLTTNKDVKKFQDQETDVKRNGTLIRLIGLIDVNVAVGKCFSPASVEQAYASVAWRTYQGFLCFGRVLSQISLGLSNDEQLWIRGTPWTTSRYGQSQTLWSKPQVQCRMVQ